MSRVFVFGAGFSCPAGLPLATQLLEPILKKLDLEEMEEWLGGMQERLAWLSQDNQTEKSFALNIEQVFHLANFDVEAFRLRQHLCPVGRDGPTPWDHSESITGWLSYLEDALRDVISECDDKADLTPILRWAKCVREGDTILTFNYDTLVERALGESGKRWTHGFDKENDQGQPVLKMHGSIDWMIAHRSEKFSKLDLIFDKSNSNRSEKYTGHAEEDYRLWRCKTSEQRREWIKGRDFQMIHQDATPRTIGIARLGSYKELHQVPGLGLVWTRGMRSLFEADSAIIVGFAMSDFDTLAQMQFAEVARARYAKNRPLSVTVVDPSANQANMQERFHRVFRNVQFVAKPHHRVEWGEF